MGELSIDAVEDSLIDSLSIDQETTTLWEGRNVFLGSNHQPKEKGSINNLHAFLGSNYTTNSPERQEKERRQREERERQEGKPDAIDNGA